VVGAAIAVGLVILTSAYLGALVLFQRRLLFPRPSVIGAPERPEDALQVWLPTAAGLAEAWYLRPRDAAPRPALLIFFHGNGELIDFLPPDFGEPRRWGMGVLLVEYPGYGRSSGSPSQEAITAVVLAAHDWAQRQGTIDSQRIVAYGRSLGGAAAAILASKRLTAALVLESTFTSIRSFAHDFWLPERAVLDPFETLPLVTAYAGPVLVLHGSRDRLVPLHHGEDLARAAQHSELEVLDCGHNDCAAAWSRIQRFLVARGIISLAGADTPVSP
jgi:pimeloyl-ACP methyl ester carboxylesterase